MNSKKDSDIKKENKYKKMLLKFSKKKAKSNSKYLKKEMVKKKIKNSQTFLNTDIVRDDGIIKLKSNEYASVISVEAIDLSLTSNTQKKNFFCQLRYLYQLKNLDLRIYKLDDRIDLNANKDYYHNLMDKYKDDEDKLSFLQERYSRLEKLEQDNLTLTSQYYFVLVSDNEKILEHQLEEIEMQCNNMTPRLNIKQLQNKLEIYQFLVNLYMSRASLEQLLWCDLTELITPLSINENTGHIKFDDEEVQLITIKNIPPFVDELFLEDLFNVPNSRCCIHIKDTIDTETLIRRLDSNYEMLSSERITTRKLSDATEMDTQKENFRELMSQIKNGDEKIKEVDFIIAINGTKKQREQQFKDFKKIADVFQIKLETPRMRQMELWQAFDIGRNILDDYKMYLPSLTLAASFPLTITHFNDATGYFLGTDIHTALPIVFDVFHQDQSRPSSNLAIIASTGGGKSFTLKKIIVNELVRGNKIFIFDAEGEYQKLVQKNKGQYIDLYSTSGGIINPLQVRFLPTDKEERINTLTGNINDDDCPLAKHLSSLETFMKCAFEDIKENQVVVMLDMIEKLYQRFGITKNTKISKLERLENTDYPIFNDLIEFLPEYKKIITNSEKLKIIDQLQILLERFKVGTDALLFNGYTTVDLEADLIAFNVKDLLYSKNKRIITTQLVNLLTYLNNIIVSNKIVNEKVNSKNDMKHISVIVDEFHLYLKNTDSDVILTFEQIARRIRKYFGNFIPTTQSIRDFIGESDSVRSATAIFNNCQYQLCGMLKDDDFATYIKLFYQNPLTDTQKEFLQKAQQGDFLLTVTNKKRLRLSIMASPMERELMGEEE